MIGAGAAGAAGPVRYVGTQNSYSGQENPFEFTITQAAGFRNNGHTDARTLRGREGGAGGL